MTNILILLAHAEETRARFTAFFAERYPALQVDIVTHHTELPRLIDTADVLMSFGKPLGPNADELVARASRLRWIQCLGTGVDNIIDLPSLRSDVLVTNMHGIHGPSMSEASLLAMLAMARDLPRSIRSQDKRIWDRRPGKTLYGKTVAIFGIGAIAEALAPRCKALGMTVTGISSAVRPLPDFDRVYPRDQLLDAVANCDFLVVLTPYSAATHRIVGEAVLAAMRPASYLVNIARGGVVDEEALIKALRERRIAGAALDVFQEEPLPPQHPFWGLDNVIITTHAAAHTDALDDAMLAIIDNNLRCFLAGDGDGMINVVPRPGDKSRPASA